MACAHPFTMQNKNYRNWLPSTYSWNKATFDVPCGWCLNCRVDKRNFLEDCCKHEFKKHGSGAFVTFTYDDISIVDKLHRDKFGNLNASLDYKDCKDFLKRLRSRINYEIKKNPNLECYKFNPKFKYVLVGEYGENGQVFDRPHYHVLFFGLDYQLCKKIFRDCWQKGHITSLPIMNGGIRYVLKYMDKQVNSKQAVEKYDDNNLVRPRLFHSTKLGYDYFLENQDFISSHNFCYKTKFNKLRPLNRYLKNKMFGKSVLDTRPIQFEMKNNYQIKYKEHSNFYSLKEINSFLHKQSLLREQNLINKSRDSLTPVSTEHLYCSFTFDDLETIVIDSIDPIPF